MSYLGLDPQSQLLNTSTQLFNGDGSTIEFFLDRSVATASDLDIIVGVIPQVPGVDYTAENLQLLFTSPPAAGANNISVTFRAGALNSLNLSAGSFEAGTVGLPSVYSVAANNTGLYWANAITLGVTVAGANRALFSSNIQSISNSTGALTVQGGIGVTGNIYQSGTLTVANATDSANIGSGAITTLGGVGMVGNLNVGGDITCIGDFTVNGTFTTTGTDSLSVADPFIFLANANPGDSFDTGVVASYNDGTQRYTGYFRDITDGKYKLFTNLTVAPTTVVDTADPSFKLTDLILSNLTATGNVAATYFVGNGSQLTGIAVASSGINNGNSTVTIPSNNGNVLANVNAVTITTISAGGLAVTGNVTATAAISATGNVTGGNVITGGLVSATGNIASSANVSGGNLITGGLILATANITGGNVITGGLITATGNVTGGNVSTAGLITATGNIRGGNLLTPGLASITGNVEAGNLHSGGIVTATGNVTGGNLITAGLITATGNVNSTANITGGNLITGGLVTATGNVQGGNVTTGGVLSATGNVNAFELNLANLKVTSQTTNAYPFVDIESLNNNHLDLLATAGRGVSMSSDTFSQLYYTSDIANVEPIDGNGLAVWLGVNGNGVYYSSNAFPAGPTWVAATNLWTFTGNVDLTGSATLSAAGNVTGGNLVTGGLITATANITGGNLITAGLITATGAIQSTANVTGGNIVTAGLITATGDIQSTANVTGGNIVTGGIVTATANITGGNIITAGLITATGAIQSTANVTGGNVIATTLVQGVTVSASGNVVAANVQTGTLSLSGNVISTLSSTNEFTTTANITGGNLLTGGLITATGNVTAGNIDTAGLITATGNITSTANITGGNITTGGIVTATGNVVAGNVSTAGLITATGNITGGNLGTGGQVSAAGNITGANLSLSAANVILSINDTSGQATTTRNLQAINGTNFLSLAAELTAAAYNPLVAVGDTGIIFSNIGTGAGGGGLSIVPWASTSGGIRLSTTANVTTVNITGSTISLVGTVTAGTNSVALGNILNNNANGVGNIGNSTGYFNRLFAQATTALYADLAEMYTADADYAPGTVLVFGGSQEVSMSRQSGDPRVAGVVSTAPAHVMNSGLQGEHTVMLALVGRVPTMVVGPVQKGDLMVSCANGRAQASASPAMGSVLGKALEDFTGEHGVIEIVVGRL